MSHPVPTSAEDRTRNDLRNLKSVDLKLGELELTLGKLLFGAARKQMHNLKALEGFGKSGDELPTEAQLVAMIGIVHASAEQFKPGLSLEMVNAAANAMDFEDATVRLMEMFAVVMGLSGVKKAVDAGAAASAGEASP